MVSLSSAFENSSVSEYLRYWLNSYCEKRLARNTIVGYKNNIERHIIPHIGDKLLFDLQPMDIEKMYSDLELEGLCGTSVLYIHAVLRKALNTAVKRRMLECNVLDYVDAPRKSKFIASVLSCEDVLKLLNVCKGTEVYIPVLLAVTLGLRRGEVLGLKWSDVNYAAKMLSISRSATCYKGEFVLSETKTKNSNRTLLMCDFVVCALKAWQAIQCQNSIGLVVTHFSGALLSSTVLNNMYHAALKAAKLPPIRFHDLRHTNATIMLQQNIPAKIVSSMLGHSSVGITLDLYSHVLTEMQRPAVFAMQNILVRA